MRGAERIALTHHRNSEQHAHADQDHPKLPLCGGLRDGASLTAGHLPFGGLISLGRRNARYASQSTKAHR